MAEEPKPLIDRIVEAKTALSRTSFPDDAQEARILRHYVNQCYELMEETLYSIVSRVEEMERKALEMMGDKISEGLDNLKGVMLEEVRNNQTKKDENEDGNNEDEEPRHVKTEPVPA